MLIILEGLPGAGKTTFARKLARKFKGILIPQIIMKFPQNYINFPGGKKERFFMKNDLEKYKKASGALKRKKIAIMDRGVFSTLAYNYASTQFKKTNIYEKILNWYKKNKNTFELPQIIFLLETSVENSLKRKRRSIPKRSEKNLLWTSPYFLKKMEIFYKNWLNKFKNISVRIVKINSNQSLEKTFKDICKKLNEFKK